MDDKSKRGPEDRTRINVNEDWELAYWSETLGVSGDQLRDLVGRVGPMVDDVRAALPNA